MPTVVVGGVVIAGWAQVMILAVVTMAAFGALRWVSRRITRRRSRAELTLAFGVTARAVEAVASAGQPDGPYRCAELSSEGPELSR